MKKMFKIIIDILMIIFMLLEYSKIYTGQLLHEVIGIILFVLFVLHNFLNKNFYKNIFKGKYNFLRTFTTIIYVCDCKEKQDKLEGRKRSVILEE